MPGTMEEIPMGEAYNKYGDSAREVEIGSIGKRVAFFFEYHIRICMRANPELKEDSSIPCERNHCRLVARTRALTLTAIGN